MIESKSSETGMEATSITKNHLSLHHSIFHDSNIPPFHPPAMVELKA